MIISVVPPHTKRLQGETASLPQRLSFGCRRTCHASPPRPDARRLRNGLNREDRPAQHEHFEAEVRVEVGRGASRRSPRELTCWMPVSASPVRARAWSYTSVRVPTSSPVPISHAASTSRLPDQVADRLGAVGVLFSRTIRRSNLRAASPPVIRETGSHRPDRHPLPLVRVDTTIFIFVRTCRGRHHCPAHDPESCARPCCSAPRERISVRERGAEGGI